MLVNGKTIKNTKKAETTKEKLWFVEAWKSYDADAMNFYLFSPLSSRTLFPTNNQMIVKHVLAVLACKIIYNFAIVLFLFE